MNKKAAGVSADGVCVLNPVHTLQRQPAWLKNQ
jgi:hypothetical protein